MRAIVYQLITSDSQLNTAGLTAVPQTVWHNYGADQRPDGDGPFAVIRWGPQEWDTDQQRTAFRHFDVYVHFPQLMGDDVFHDIDEIFDRMDAIFDAANDDSVIYDGYELGYIEPEGRSNDLDDSGYQTFCRYASYKATAHKVP